MCKRVIAFIPMKCHSERVKDKNIRLFNGKPLFYWIIRTLLKIEQISQIVIDTDCEKIANKVKEFFDLTIIMRPKRLRGDFVSVNKLIENVLSIFKDNNYFLQTHTTNPLLSSFTIKNAIDFYFKNLQKYDSVFSVTRHQSRFYDHLGNPINHDPKKLIRTQDLKPLYEENSNFYLFSRESFFKNRTRVGKNPFLYEVDKLEAIDIDTEEDFLLAELLMKEKIKNGK